MMSEKENQQKNLIIIINNKKHTFATLYLRLNNEMIL